MSTWNDNFCKNIVKSLEKRLVIYKDNYDKDKLKLINEKMLKLLDEEFSSEELKIIISALEDNVKGDKTNFYAKLVLCQYYALYNDNIQVLRKFLERGLNFISDEQDYLFCLDEEYKELFSEEENVDIFIKNKKLFYNCLEYEYFQDEQYLDKVQEMKVLLEIFKRRPEISKVSYQSYEVEDLPDLNGVEDRYLHFLKPQVVEVLGVRGIINLSERQIQMLNAIEDDEVIRNLCELLKQYPTYTISSTINSKHFFVEELFILFNNKEIVDLTEEQVKKFEMVGRFLYQKLKEVYDIDQEAFIPDDVRAINDLALEELVGLSEKDALKIEEIYKDFYEDGNFKRIGNLVKEINLLMIKMRARKIGKEKVKKL